MNTDERTTALIKRFSSFIAVSIITVVMAATFLMGETITIMQNKVEIDSELKAFAKVFEKSSGITVNVKSCGGDSCSLGTQLLADFNAGEAPDIFPIDGSPLMSSGRGISTIFPKSLG